MIASPTYVYTYVFDVLQRLTITQILEDQWFREGYNKPEEFKNDEEVNLDDIDAVFSESNVICLDPYGTWLFITNGSKYFYSKFPFVATLQDHLVTEKEGPRLSKPTLLNAFELISLSRGLNLSGLFGMKQVCILLNRSSIT